MSFRFTLEVQALIDPIGTVLLTQLLTTFGDVRGISVDYTCSCTETLNPINPKPYMGSKYPRELSES